MYGDPSLDPGLTGDPMLDQWEIQRRQQQQAVMPPQLLPAPSAPVQRPDYATPMPTSLDPGQSIQARDDQATQLDQQAHQDDIQMGNVPDDRPPPSVPVTPDVPDQPQTSALPPPEPVEPHPTTNRDGVEQWDPLIQTSSMKYGVPVNVIKAIIDMESGGRDKNDDGTPLTSAAGAIGPMQVMLMHATNGEDLTDPATNIDIGTKLLADNYAHYGDWNKAAAAYFGAIDADGNVTGAQDATGTDGYAYVDKFRGLASTYADQGDNPVSGPNEPDKRPVDISDLRPSQFGDDELSAAEAYSACGPAAAIAFAAMYGKYPTLRQAVDIAKKIGAWDEGEGMHGPDAEVRLIEAMGGKAKIDPGFDPDKVSQEVMGGNPVIVDAPGHYGVISGYDPTTQKFYFGTSATDLKGGSPWMTIDEYQSLNAVGGPVRATLYADNPLSPNGSYAATPGPSTTPATWKPDDREDPEARAARESSEAATKLATDVNASVEKQMADARSQAPQLGDPNTGLVGQSPTIQPDSSTPSWLQQAQSVYNAVFGKSPTSEQATSEPPEKVPGSDWAPGQPLSNLRPEDAPDDQSATSPSVFPNVPGQPDLSGPLPPGDRPEPTSGQSIVQGIISTIAQGGEAGQEIASTLQSALNPKAGPTGTINPLAIQAALFALPHDLYQRALDEIGLTSDVARGVSGNDPILLARDVATSTLGYDPFPSVQTLNPQNRPAMDVLGTMIVAPFMPGSEALGMAAPPDMTIGFMAAGGVLERLPGANRFLLGRLTSFIEGQQALDGFQVIEDGIARAATRADLRSAYERRGAPDTPGLIPATNPGNVIAAAQNEAENALEVAHRLVQTGQITVQDSQRLAASAAQSYYETALRDSVRAARDPDLSDAQRSEALQASASANQSLKQWEARLQQMGAPSLHVPPPLPEPSSEPNTIEGQVVRDPTRPESDTTSLVHRPGEQPPMGGSSSPLTPSDRTSDLVHQTPGVPAPIANAPTPGRTAPLIQTLAPRPTVPVGNLSAAVAPPALPAPSTASDRTSESPVRAASASSAASAFQPDDITIGQHQVIGSQGLQPGTTSLAQLEQGHTVTAPNDVTVRGQALIDARGREVGQRIPDEQLTLLGNRPYAQQSVAMARAILNGNDQTPGVQSVVDGIARQLGFGTKPNPPGQITELIPGAVNVSAANDFRGNIAISPWHILQSSLVEYRALYPDHTQVDPEALAKIYSGQTIEAVSHESAHDYNIPDERGIGVPGINTPAQVAARFNDQTLGVHGSTFSDLQQGFKNWKDQHAEEYQKIYDLALQHARAILSGDDGNLQQFSADATALRQSGAIGSQRRPVLLGSGIAESHDVGGGLALSPARGAGPPTETGGGLPGGAPVQRGENGLPNNAIVQGTDGLGSEPFSSEVGGSRRVEETSHSNNPSLSDLSSAEPAPFAASFAVDTSSSDRGAARSSEETPSGHTARSSASTDGTEVPGVTQASPLLANEGSTQNRALTRHNIYDKPISSVEDLKQAIWTSLVHWVRQPDMTAPQLGESMRQAGLEMRAQIMAQSGPDLADRLFGRGSQDIIVDDLFQELKRRNVTGHNLDAAIKSVQLALTAQSSEAAKLAVQQVSHPSVTESPTATVEPPATPTPANRTSDPNSETAPSVPRQKVTVQSAVAGVGDHETIREMSPQKAANYGAKIRQDLIVDGDQDATTKARQAVLDRIDQIISDIRSVSHQKPGAVLDDWRSELRDLGDERNKYGRLLRTIRSNIGQSNEIPIPQLTGLRDPHTGMPIVTYRQRPSGNEYDAIIRRIGVMADAAPNATNKRALEIVAKILQKQTRIALTDAEDMPVSMEQFVRGIRQVWGYSNLPEGEAQFMHDLTQFARQIHADPSIVHSQVQTMAALSEGLGIMMRDLTEKLRVAAKEDATNNQTMEYGQNANETYTGPLVKAVMKEAQELLEASGIFSARAQFATAAGRNLRMMQVALNSSDTANRLEFIRQAEGERNALKSIVERVIAAAQKGEKNGENRFLENLRAYQNGEITPEQLRNLPDGALIEEYHRRVGDFPGFMDMFARQDIIPLAQQIATNEFLQSVIPDVNLVRQIQAAVEQYAKTGDMPSLPEEQIRAALSNMGNMLKAGQRARNRAATDGVSYQTKTKAAYRATEAGWKELLNEQVKRSAKNARALTQQLVNNLADAVTEASAQGAIEYHAKLLAKLKDETEWLASRGYLQKNRAQDAHLRGGMSEESEAMTISDLHGLWQKRLGELADAEQALDSLRKVYLSHQLELNNPSHQQHAWLQQQIDDQHAIRDSIQAQRTEIHGEMLSDLLPKLVEEFQGMSALEQTADAKRLNDGTMERYLEATTIAHLGYREEGWLSREVVQAARSGIPFTAFENHLREQLAAHYHNTADETRGVQYQLAALGDLEKEFGGSEDPAVQSKLEDMRMQVRTQIDGLERHGEEGRNTAKQLVSKYIATVYGHGGGLVSGLIHHLTSPNYPVNVNGQLVHADAVDLKAFESPDIYMKLVGHEGAPGPVRRILEGIVTDGEDIHQADKDFQQALAEVTRSLSDGMGQAFQTLLHDAMEVEKLKAKISDLVDMVEKNPNDMTPRVLTEIQLRGLHDIVTDHEVDPWFRSRYAGTELAMTRAYEKAVAHGADRLAQQADEAEARQMYLAHREASGQRIKGAQLSTEEERDIASLKKKSIFEVLTERAEKDRVQSMTQDIQALRRQLWTEASATARADIQQAIDRRLDELERVGTVLTGADKPSIGQVAADRLRATLEQDATNEAIKAMVRQAQWADKDEVETLSKQISLLHEVLYGRMDGRKAKLTNAEANELTDLRTRRNVTPENVTAAQETRLLELLARGVSLTSREESELTQSFVNLINHLANTGYSMDDGVSEGVGLTALAKLKDSMASREDRWADHAVIAEARAQISWLANEMWKEPDFGVRRAFLDQIDGALGHIRQIQGRDGDLGIKTADRIEQQLQDMEIRQLGMGQGTVGRAEIRQDRATLQAEIVAQRSYIKELHGMLLQGYDGAEEAAIRAEMQTALQDLAAIGANRTDPELRDLGLNAYNRTMKELGIREQNFAVRDVDRKVRRQATLDVRDLRQEALTSARRLIEQPGSIQARQNLSRALSDMRQITYTEHVQRRVPIRNAKGGLVRYEQQMVQQVVPYGEQEANKLAEQIGLRTDTLSNILTAGNAPSLSRASTQGGIAGLRDRLARLRQAGISTGTLGEFTTEMRGLLDGLDRFGEAGRQARLVEIQKNRAMGAARAGQMSDPENRARVQAFFQLIDPNAPPAEVAGDVRTAMRIIQHPNFATFYREWGLAAKLMTPVSWGLTGAHTISKAANSVLGALRWATRLGLDVALSHRQGGVRSTYGSEAGAFVGGAWRAWRNVAHDTGQIWWYGNAMRDIENAQANQDMSKIRGEDLVSRWGPQPEIINGQVVAANSAPQAPNLLDRIIGDGYTENLAQRSLFLLGSWAQMSSLRIFRASDSFIGGLAYAGALEAQIERKARQLGIPRAQVRRDIVEYPDIIQNAGRIREDILLQRRSAILKSTLGPISQFIRRGRADQNWWRQLIDVIYSTYLPFTTIPANIIQQGLSLSPPGAVVHSVRTVRALTNGAGTLPQAEVREAAEQGVPIHQLALLDPTRERARARAIEEQTELTSRGSHAILAAITTAVAIALAAKSMIRPDDPTDRNEINKDEAEHKTPLQLWWGNSWMSYEGLPVAIPFAMVANAFTQYDDAYKKLMGHPASEGTALENIAAGTAAAGYAGTRAIFHNFFLQNLLSAASIVTDPHQRETMATAMYNLESPWIQGNIPAIFNYMARLGDDWERDTRVDTTGTWHNNLGFDRLGNLIASSVPGLRGGLAVRTDVKGDPIPNHQGAGAGFLPHATNEVSDPIFETLDYYGEHYPEAPTQLQAQGLPQGTKFNITLDEQSFWKSRIDNYLRSEVNQTLTDPSFNVLHPGVPGISDSDNLAKQQAAQMHLAVTKAEHLADQDVINRFGNQQQQASEIERRLQDTIKKQSLNWGGP